MLALTRIAGRIGDRNGRAMTASALLAEALGRRLATAPTTVGRPEPALAADWRVELDAAAPLLREVSARMREVLRRGERPVTALGRCAAAIATLPAVAQAEPDAVVVWFDAHADLNIPTSTPTGYLGGLALSAALGMWESGLGSGLSRHQAILVGARDLDPAELELTAVGGIQLVPVGDGMAERLGALVAGRPVYVHLDCDVLEPGLVPTEYRVDGGMRLEELRACAAALAAARVIGVEIAELEAEPGEDAMAAVRVVDALEPLWGALGAPDAD
ncbi:arginase family protein [Homoserinibacter sp. YIM 151385]|uniref:arginase family protein n=1 Tax=Homoserinibacter sp. YIM 151385 TaxID=2985506 RepID=UPI0022F050C3|nr:arginase family protein [Homoserinibacter sp. YIM 151385]WBU37327.1 arginase family protein [Homoserinibacter sp. YIM 151385]